MEHSSPAAATPFATASAALSSSMACLRASCHTSTCLLKALQYKLRRSAAQQQSAPVKCTGLLLPIFLSSPHASRRAEAVRRLAHAYACSPQRAGWGDNRNQRVQPSQHTTREQQPPAGLQHTRGPASSAEGHLVIVKH
jgi:hypothetical protein